MATVVSVLKDVTFALRQHALLMKQMSSRVQKVSPIEPLQGPWTGSNNFGQYILVEGQSNVQKAVLKLPEWGMPEVWTIMLGLDLSRTNLTGATYFGLTAIIEAGCGGALQSFEVDWRNGTLISIPMNSLSVVVKYDLAISTNPPTGDIRVTSTIARGARAGAHHPIRTIVAPVAGTTIANNALSPYIEIPRFATRMALSPRGLGMRQLLSPDLQVWWYANTGGVAVETTPAALQHECMPEGLMIPSGAYYVRLYNRTGSEVAIPNYRFTIGV